MLKTEQHTTCPLCRSLPPAEDIEYFEKASARVKEGRVWAYPILAGLYSKGKGVEKNESKAVELLEKGAGLGETTCMLNLATHYINNKRDFKKALKNFELAGRAGKLYFSPIPLPIYFLILFIFSFIGHPEGFLGQSKLYFTGNGVKKNLKNSFKLAVQAAEAGSLGGNIQAGVALHHGKGVEKSHYRAIKYYMRAAEGGIIFI